MPLSQKHLVKMIYNNAKSHILGYACVILMVCEDLVLYKLTPPGGLVFKFSTLEVESNRFNSRPSGGNTSCLFVMKWNLSVSVNCG